MPTSNLFSYLYSMCEGFTRLVYVNLLWILFSVIGLLLFGIGPATSAMFTVIRKWVVGQEDINVFQTFWQAYKQDFWKANAIMWILVLGAYLLYIDFLFIGNFGGLVTTLLSGLLLFFTLLYLLILVYIYPIFVSFKLKPLQYVKYAIHFGLSSPMSMLTIIGTALFMYYLIIFIPAVFPFFSGSVISFVIMKQAKQIIKKIENKHATA
ncbi:YesL family protein [Aquibacillus koreensis]|uniref:YesL family protein n=1 Tax=Aquibacillus koreensis TaxID=279446 RepID=A0A9X4AJ42_9BACI|nr:YesL family protein [Aquibacillus koreensis]MCT2537069.1 YesL family protein [Aquibacillus koreensis]MDC3419948.1 YesL family protein [Aquibacillus koreensis]